MNSYFFLKKKKKGKHEGITSASQKKKKKHRKLPALVIQLKYVALRVYTKLSNYTALHLLLTCFIILVIPPVFFPQDVFGYDNPISLEIELSERKQGQRQGGCSQDWREEGKGKESP